ncbi:hypothetical protein WJX84_006587, partial [Apatococcus fuscideae]
MAAFQTVPAPQTTDNALLATDTSILATDHHLLATTDTLDTTVELGEVELPKAELVSPTSWPPPDQPNLSYFKLYKYCDKLDYLLIFLGALGAAASGAAIPVFSLVFGKIINVLGKGGSPAGLISEVNTVTKYFSYLGVVSFVASFFQMSMWSIT